MTRERGLLDDEDHFSPGMSGIEYFRTCADFAGDVEPEGRQPISSFKYWAEYLKGATWIDEELRDIGLLPPCTTP